MKIRETVKDRTPTPSDSQQLQIFAHDRDVVEGFKRLYYHLYTNSNASRAERINADLSKLLLVRVLSLRKPSEKIGQKFLAGEASANEDLFPRLQREFPTLLDHHDRFSLDDRDLRVGYSSISSLNLADAPAHVLGEAFQALIGPRLRGDKGQFFTPKSVVRAMVSIVAPAPCSTVVDPACGTGGFLAETAFFWAKHGHAHGKLIGVDKDRDLTALATAMLGLVVGNSAQIINSNSLDISINGSATKELLGQVDYVLTNPPFGAKIAVTEEAVLRNYALAHIWKFDETTGEWQQSDRLATAEDPQILFLELCVRLLKSGGMLGIVLPEGVFGNKGSGYVWDYLRRQGTVTALIDCPRTTFQPGTDTKTNVLFFRKGNGGDSIQLRSAPVVRVAVAIHCGHDRRGRTISASGERYPDDFEIISAEQQETSKSGMWSECTITNPHYWVPRYYDAKNQRLLEEDAAKYDATLLSLGELVSKNWLEIRKGDEVGADAYGTGDYPFVRTSDISNFEISIDPTKSVSADVFERYAPQQRLRPGDILMVVDGRYRIGRCAILHESNYECVAQSHLRILSVTASAPFKPIELLLLLNLPSVQREIRSLVFIQSTLGSLGSRLSELKVPIPRVSPKWARQVSRFAELIDKRAEILARLREFEPAIPEL